MSRYDDVLMLAMHEVMRPGVSPAYCNLAEIWRRYCELETALAVALKRAHRAHRKDAKPGAAKRATASVELARANIACAILESNLPFADIVARTEAALQRAKANSRIRSVPRNWREYLVSALSGAKKEGL